MNKTQNELSIEKIILKARDGYPVSATRYISAAPVKGHIVIAGGVGIPQKFYGSFARYAAKMGFTSMTLDYRGIGESKPATLKGFRATTIDWAQMDLAAAVDFMKEKSVPLFMVGHSYGGHTLGLLPNHHLVDRMYTFATGTGWTGWMPRLEGIRIRLLFGLIGPVIAKINGYMKWGRLGMGEDLPLAAYREWSYWCGFPHYYFDDPEMKNITALYKNIRTPIKAANSLDDRWALPRSRDAFLKGYSNAPIETMDINPASLEMEIGHMGYFKPFAVPLWDDVLEWFMKPLNGIKGS